jgi:LPS sulfotransferase NodH
MAPFLIYSLKRSGSTSLMRVLNALPGVRCMREPFNPDNYGGRYRERVRDGLSLRSVMHELWAGYDGIKHVWESDGWPFHAPELNAQVALEPGQRVVFLRRRNVLQRTVSLQISQQAGVWSAIPSLDRERLARFEFVPLDANVIKQHVASEAALLDGLRDQMIDARATFIEAWYEDLYDPTVSDETRRARVAPLLTFLGLSLPNDVGTLDIIDRLLDPAATRLNSEEQYARIPEIEAIEAECGSDETGWLFTESRLPSTRGS